MVVSVVLGRDDFLQWLGGSLIPRTSSGFYGRQVLRQDEILVLWREFSGPPDLGNAPIISVRRDALREFFAFTATYVSTYSPFSSFFRVVPIELLPDLLEALSAGSKGDGIPEELVGTAIAEAFLQTGGDLPIDEISIQAGLATVSSAMIAAAIRGYSRETVEGVVTEWNSAREAFNQEQPKFTADASLAFWLPLFDALLGNEKSTNPRVSYDKIVRFVRSQVAGGFGTETDEWRALSQELPPLLRTLIPEKNVSREEQVRNIDYATKLLIESEGVTPLLREVIAGFAIARVSGGAIEYLNLCGPFVEKLPRAVLWFAFFAGCWRGGTVLTAANCLGRRIARQLFTWSGPFSNPVCDISYLELASYVFERKTAPKLRTEQQAVVTVELLPGVNARVRMRSEKTAKTERNAAPDQRALQDLRATLRSAITLVEQLGNEQPSLFRNLSLNLRRDKRPKNAKN